MTTRRHLIAASASLAAAAAQPPAGAERYLRFRTAPATPTVWGRLHGDTIHALTRAPYLGGRESGKKHALAKVKLAAPIEASKLLAVGLNYRSHIGDRPVPKQPEIFYKPITCLQDPGGPIVIPADAQNVTTKAKLCSWSARAGAT